MGAIQYERLAPGPLCAMLGVVTDQGRGASGASDLRGFWRERRRSLERMTLRQLTAVYFRHPAVAAYLALVAASAALVVLLRPGSPPAGPLGLAAAAAFGAGVLSALFYEFCHCVEYLPYTPRNPVLRCMKRLHLLHHLHNERGNFGITNFVVDRLAGTYYSRASDVPRRPTAFDLGYTDAERVRYPWLAQRSEPGDAGR